MTFEANLATLRPQAPDAESAAPVAVTGDVYNVAFQHTETPGAAGQKHRHIARCGKLSFMQKKQVHPAAPRWRYSNGRRRGIAMAATAGIAALLIWNLREGSASAPPPAPAPAAPAVARAPSPFGDGPAVIGPDAEPAPTVVAHAAEAASAPVPSGAPPAGLSAEQWRQLQESLRGNPNREAELARIAEYLGFQQTLQQYRTRRSQGAAPAELQALARQIDQGIDIHLARGELSAGEANLLKSTVLIDIEPDPGQRAAMLNEWRDQQAQAPAAADPRAEQYRQRQAEIVAAWQAQPPERRDAQQLQAQLETLRQSTFGNSPGR